MKTIKSELLKIMIIIIVINIFAVIGSVVLQHHLLVNSEYTTKVSSTDFGEADEVENSNTKSIEAVEVKKIVIIPYIYYIGMILLSIIYGIYEVHKVLNQIDLFKTNCEQSLITEAPNSCHYQLSELEAINQLLNNALIDIKNSKRLEKELVTFTMHDIKTPLQIIQGNLDLLKLNSNVVNMSSIEMQVARINQMIESNLNVEHLITENICFMIEQLIDEYKQVYPNIKFKLITQEVVMWEINHQAFRRILTNIIDNGIKNMSNQTKSFNITVTPSLITVANSTDLKQVETFEQMVATSSGYGLRIIEKYARIHKLKPSILINHGYFEFTLFNTKEFPSDYQKLRNEDV